MALRTGAMAETRADDLAQLPAAMWDVLNRARELGMLGPGPVRPHVEHARGFLSAAGRPPSGLSLDLGSGGGLPGLPLALMWPTSRWVLLDANERRVQFLAEAVTTLSLGDRVSVVRLRAEELGRSVDWRGQFQLVVARSFAEPAVTAECAAPLLAVGAKLIVSEPPVSGIARWEISGLRALGLGAPQVSGVSGKGYCVMHQIEVCPSRFPRRTGIPTKRPLF